jgi:hypothetical protein
MAAPPCLWASSTLQLEEGVMVVVVVEWSVEGRRATKSITHDVARASRRGV